MSEEQIPISPKEPDEYELHVHEVLARNDELPSAPTAAAQIPSEAVVIYIQPAQLTHQPVSTVTRQTAARNGRDCACECGGTSAPITVVVCTVVLLVLGFLAFGPLGLCCVVFLLLPILRYLALVISNACTYIYYSDYDVHQLTAC